MGMDKVVWERRKARLKAVWDTLPPEAKAAYGNEFRRGVTWYVAVSYAVDMREWSNRDAAEFFHDGKGWKPVREWSWDVLMGEVFGACEGEEGEQADPECEDEIVEEVEAFWKDKE